MKKRPPRNGAMELTTFALKGGSIADFIAANADVDAWLARQRGFRLRRIAEQDDGSIVDMLLWDSVADAERAAERLLVELSGSPVHAMIDHRTVRWSVAPVRHASGERASKQSTSTRATRH